MPSLEQECSSFFIYVHISLCKKKLHKGPLIISAENFSEDSWLLNFSFISDTNSSLVSNVFMCLGNVIKYHPGNELQDFLHIRNKAVILPFFFI